MKAYFTAAIAKNDQLFKHYQDIVIYLRHLKHDVLSSHTTDASKPTIDKVSRQDLLDFQNKVEHWIHDCDFMIADTTLPSVSVGYEISCAMRLGKPILVFYERNGPPSLLRHHKNENLVLERYDPKTYRESIEQFIRTIEGHTETKFIFLITPEIAAFLNNIVSKEKTPKSVYVRKLIEKDMKNHDFAADI